MRSEQLSASLEDYLEAIFNITSKNGGVRSKDIAKYLNVKAGSVTAAMRTLAKSKHINYQPYRIISLTPKGIEEARGVIRKHEFLESFFMDILGADLKVAADAACKIEHVITEELVEKLVSFTEFIQRCPHCGTDLVQQFHNQCSKKTACSKKKRTNRME
jgi:DtxR family Mn-dependent transcriptional regulator